jgi:hypothetical protein
VLKALETTPDQRPQGWRQLEADRPRVSDLVLAALFVTFILAVFVMARMIPAFSTAGFCDAEAANRSQPFINQPMLPAAKVSTTDPRQTR